MILAKNGTIKMTVGRIRDHISIVAFTILTNLRFSRGILMLYCLSLGLDIIEFGLVQTVYSVSRFIFEIPSGMISDVFKRERVLSLAAFLSGAVYLALFLMDGRQTDGMLYILLVLFSVDAFASTLISGTDQALIYEILPQEQREKRYARYLSYIQIAALISLSLSTMSGGLIADLGMQLTFVSQALCLFLGSIIINFVKVPDKTVEKEDKRNRMTDVIRSAIKIVRSKRDLLLLILFFAVIELNVNAVTIFIQDYLRYQGSSVQLITMVIGSATLCGIVGALGSSVFTRVRITYFMFISGAILLSSLLSISIDMVALIVIGFLMLNILLDLIYPGVSKYINDRCEDENRATMISFSSFASGMISSVCYIFLGSSISSFGYDRTFLGIGVISFIIIACLTFLFIKEGQECR